MRMFVAIDLGENVIEKISEIQEKLGKGDFDLKIVEPENLHLTLKFLGEVDEAKVGYIEKSASEVVKNIHRFKMVFEGIGYFGSERHMNVIWVGVKVGKEEFVKLARSLDEKLADIRKDEHESSPHLTIARVKSGRNRELLLHEVKSLNDVKIGEVDVKEIKLKQSVLTPQGPIYSDVKAFDLKGKSE